MTRKPPLCDICQTTHRSAPGLVQVACARICPQCIAYIKAMPEPSHERNGERVSEGCS